MATNGPGNYSPIPLPGTKITPGVTFGRVLADGYRRGLGLQYGGISDVLAQDWLYQKAVANGSVRSVVTPLRREDLFLVMTHFFEQLDSKNIIEFGSYRGGNAIFMATIAQELYPEAKIYALDTYAGMPATDDGIDAAGAGIFIPEGGVSEIRAYAKALGLTNIEFVEGLFEDTLPGLLASGLKFGMAHIDADIYSACKYVQDAIWPALVPGGYLIYDDALDSACMGAMHAVEDLVIEKGIRTEQVFPHVVFRAHL